MTGILFEAGQFNVNGIVAARGWLIVVDTFTGGLFRVDPATGDATQISTGGVSVENGDGLEIRGSTLYVVRNSTSCRGLPTRPRADICHVARHLTDRGPERADYGCRSGRRPVGRQRPIRIPTTDYWVSQLPTKP